MLKSEELENLRSKVEEYCKRNSIGYNTFAEKCGVPESSMYNFMNRKQGLQQKSADKMWHALTVKHNEIILDLDDTDTVLKVLKEAMAKRKKFLEDDIQKTKEEIDKLTEHLNRITEEYSKLE